MAPRSSLIVGLLLSLSGCGSSPTTDAGRDATTAMDAGRDASPAIDAGRDDGLDAAFDGGSDAGFAIPECAEHCVRLECVSRTCVDGACLDAADTTRDGMSCRHDDLCMRGSTCASGVCGDGVRRRCAICDPTADGFLITFFGRRPDDLALRPGGLGLTGFDGDVWITSVNDDGTVAFDESFGNPRFGDWGRALVALPDGLLAVGYSQVVRPQLPFVVRTDATGAAVFTRAYYDDVGGDFRGVAAHPDGGFVVMGFAGGENVWLRIDAAGAPVWMRSAAMPAPALAGAVTDIATFTDGFAFAYETGDFTGGYAVELVRLELDGAVRWRRELPPDTSLIGPHALLGLADGTMLIGGRKSRGFPLGSAWLAMLEADGAMRWEQSYGSDINAAVHDIAPVGDGTYLLATEGEGDAILRVVGADGFETASQRLDFGASESATSVAVTPTGDIYVAGSSHLRGDADALPRTDGWVLRAPDLASLACD